MKFIHAADIHLDSPLRRLADYEGAPVDEIRTAPRRALENLVELAIEEAVDFVLIAGDVYDGDWDDYSTGLFFVAQMNRLGEHHIPVVTILGNHDAQSKITKSLPLPKHVRQLSHHAPETVLGEEIGVQAPLAIHGWSYAQAAELRNLAAEYPAATPGAFNIGLLHTSLAGASDEHEHYAPCSLEDLHGKHYDYWALGHIHKRQMLPEQPAAGDPIIAYPGNIQGRHIRETGVKGCLLVEVDGGAAPRVEFRSLDVFRWELCQLDAADAESRTELLDRFSHALRQICQQHQEMPLAVRVELTGRTALHLNLAAHPERLENEIRAAATTESAGKVWIEEVKLRTAPQIDFDRSAWEDTPMAELADIVREWQSAENPIDVMSGELASLRGKIPPEFWRDAAETPGGADEDDDPLDLREVLAEAEALLWGRLQEEETDA